MNGFKRLAVEIGVLAAVIGLALWFAHKRSVSTIPPNTDATISVEGTKVTIDENNKHIVQYAPKGTKIVINKDGSVKVISKQYGLSRELGAAIAIEGPHVFPAADMKLAYYMRLGLNVGVGIRLDQKFSVSSVRPYVALSYALPFASTSNTSLFVGHSIVSDQWLAGIRVSF